MSPFQILAYLALLFAVVIFTRKLQRFTRLPRPVEKAAARGSAGVGIAYAYTLGMAPWAKESTRRHAIAYLRGVGFHLGIFLVLGLLVLSPWIPDWSSTLRYILAGAALFGGLLGLAGFAMRLVETNLRSLSTGDDYFAVLVVSLMQLAAALWLVLPATAWLFYLLAAVTLGYAPLGKIKHCIYYAFSRLFFGRFTGTRGVLPHSQQQGAR